MQRRAQRFKFTDSSVSKMSYFYIFYDKMQDLVEVDCEKHNRLLDFCLSSIQKEKEKAIHVKEKIENLKQLRISKEVLMQKMKEENQSVVKVVLSPDEHVWIVLKQRLKAEKANVVTILKILESINLETIPNQYSRLVPFLKEYLYEEMKGKPTDDHILKFLKKQPSNLPYQKNDKLVQLADSVLQCEYQKKDKQQQFKKRTMVFEEKCKKEKNVAESYIKSVDTEGMFAPLKLKINGKTENFYMKRKEKKGVIGKKKLIELTLETVSEILSDMKLSDSIVSITKIQEQSLLNNVYKMLTRKCEEVKNSKEKQYNVVLQKSKSDDKL